MSFRLALALVAASGFIALSYELLWFRICAFASGNSPLTFGVLLAFYLVGLAAGAMGTRRYCVRYPDGEARGGGQALAGLAVFFFFANVVGYAVIPATARLGVLASWGLGLPLVALAAGLLGAVLPLVSHFGVAPDHLAGARLSYLYVSNILGSVAGSLLTGFVLMDRWPVSTLALALALTGFALSAAMVIGARLPAARWVPALALTGLTSLGAVAVNDAAFDRLWERLFFQMMDDGELRFDRVLENRHDVIAITEQGRVFGGGVYDGFAEVNALTDRNLLLRAYALAAMHPEPTHVLMVGLSMGAWAQVVANMPGVETLTVVEINPGYLELIPQYPEVASLLENPRVTIVIDDGRRWLTRHPERQFDLVVINTSFHWRSHMTTLLSREFQELVKSRLAPGGIYAFNTTWSDDVLKTAFTVFPHGYRVDSFAVVSPDPFSPDRGRWRAALEAWQIDGRPLLDREHPQTGAAAREKLASLLSLLDTLDDTDAPAPNMRSREAMLLELEHAGVITDDNMLSEWRHNKFR